MKTTREKWLEERKTYLGGSDLPAILGLDAYNTPYNVWASKTGRDVPFEGNAATRLGITLQPVVAAYFQEQHPQYKVINNAENKIYKHPKIEIAGCTPDVLYSIDGKMIGTIQIKTRKKPVSKLDVPKPYFVQNIWEVGCTGLQRGGLAWMAAMELDFIEYDFDKKFFEYLVERAIKFWDRYVKTDTPPPPVNLADIKLLFKKATIGKQIKANPFLITNCTKLKGVRKRIALLNETKDELEFAIKKRVKDGELVMHNKEVIATWKTDADSKEFDVEALRLQQPRIYKKYLRTKFGSRRLLIK